MQKTTFKINKMDCPSEEQMIRMKLNEQIFQRLDTLKFDTLILSTVTVDNFTTTYNQNDESKTLWTVLIINFLFFAIEIVTGLISNSMGLVADSLDMLADSIVYGLALIAVGGTVVRKENTAEYNEDNYPYNTESNNG